jgi:tetratricopeptide (TPR) repeat protein
MQGGMSRPAGSARIRVADPRSAVAAAPWWRRDPSPVVASLAIVVLALVAYANTFGHGFVWDDTILLDQKARFYRGPLDAWFEPAGLPNMRMYRPLEMMSLWVDLRLWQTPTGFHVTQVLLHALTSVLVLALARALGAAPWAALAGAAVFVLHPVQVESVAWITCRADVMTATFATIAVLLLLRHQDAPTWWTIVLAAVMGFLATAAKETGSVTPVLMLAAVAVVPRPPLPLGARLGRAWPMVLAALAGVLLCQSFRPAEVTTGIGRDGFALHDLVNLAGAFSYQLARVLAPLGFSPYTPTTPTDAAHLILAVAGGAALLAALVLPARDGGIRRLAVLWFLIAVAPAVAVVLADFSVTPVAERRLYLGMVAVALLVAGLLTERRALAGSTAGVAAIATVLVALFATTVVRNGYWRSELTLWTAVTERMHDDATPYSNLGLALAAAGKPADAETAYRRALQLTPRDGTRQRASINLGLLLVERGEIDEAERLFTEANAIGGHAIAFRGLGMVARKRAQAAQRAGDRATAAAELTEAHAALTRAIAINPRYAQAHFTLAGVLYDAGQYRAAVPEYQQAAALATEPTVRREATDAAQQLSSWLAQHPEAP